MLKILQARLQQYMNHELPYVQAGFIFFIFYFLNFYFYFILLYNTVFKLNLGKTKEPEIKLPTSTGSLKKQESSRKTSTSALLTMPKPLTVWITINCGKF